MPHKFLDTGGEMGARIAEKDWSETPLGPIESWSAALRITLATLLSSPHPMRVWWGQALVQLYNDAYIPILGPRRHPAMLGESAYTSWPELHEMIDDSVELAQQGKAQPVRQGRFLLPRPGFDEERWYERSSSPVFDEHGELVGILGIGNDTTRQVIGHRRLETLTRLRVPVTTSGRSDAEIIEQMLDALDSARADLARTALYRVDRRGLLHCLGRTGATPEAGGGVHELPSVIDPADAAAPPVATRLGGATAFFDPVRATFIEPSDASQRPAEGWFVAPLCVGEDDTRIGLLLIEPSPHLPFDADYRDYLELLATYVTSVLSALQTRARLEHERETLALQLAQAPVPMSMVTGPDLVFELANPLYLEMVGRTEAIIGLPLREAFAELPDDAPIFSIVREVFDSGRSHTAEQYCIPIDRTGDGELEDVYFRFTCQPFRDAHDRIVGVMTAAVDVTAQVLATRHLETLAQRERAARAEAEQANQTKDQFLAMLGHELRNPLAPIRTAVRLLQMRGLESRELDIIERQTHHLIRLVDDLLDVSRIARGKFELNPRRVELASCIERGVEMAQPLFEHRHQRLELAVPTSGLPIVVDPDRMAQVVSNLLTNASRYSAPGTTVRVTASRDDHTVTWRVRDEGIGISSEMLPRVFDMFQQQAQAIDRSSGGLGLGLTIVRNIVEKHDGTVRADSEGLGHGSQFTVTLPLATAPSPDVDAPGATTPSDAPHTPRTLRILIVDDNEDAAQLQAALLEQLGHHTRVVYDGLSALQAAEQYTPDVCLLDIGLPVLDGYEVARRLRLLPGHSTRLRIIAVTGYGQSADRARSAEAGIDAHLVKPVDQSELATTIAGLVDGALTDDEA